MYEIKVVDTVHPWCPPKWICFILLQM